MPRRKTSIKSTRKDKKRRLRNMSVKQQLRKTIKQFLTLLSAKSASEAKALLPKVFSQLDKASKKKIIPRGTADRRKSRLMKRLTASK